MGPHLGDELRGFGRAVAGDRIEHLLGIEDAAAVLGKVHRRLEEESDIDSSGGPNGVMRLLNELGPTIEHVLAGGRLEDDEATQCDDCGLYGGNHDRVVHGWSAGGDL